MESPDILLIVLDTLRADRSEPVWNVLKEHGFRSYENVVAPSPWTIPSHASIFTGKYPISHGVHETKEKKAFNIKFNNKKDLLSEELEKMGYSNYLLTANPYITGRFGYTGFRSSLELLHDTKIQVLNEEESREMSRLRSEKGSTTAIIRHLISEGKIGFMMKGILNRILGTPPITYMFNQYQFKVRNWPFDKGAQKMVDHLTSTILTGSGSPKFMMVNMMEVHEPYFEKPILSMKLNLNERMFDEIVDGPFKDKIERAYMKETEYLARTVGKLISFMKEKDLLKNTLVIITSDHGQLLGEHDQLGHGTFLHDELLMVPLFIKFPDKVKLKVCKKNGGYISLVSIYDLILRSARGSELNEEDLYSDYVYSETHGISNIFEPTEDIEREKMESLERFKIAVYGSGHKIIFDVGSFKVEESLGPEGEISEEMEKDLSVRALSYLKKIESERISKVKFQKRI